MTGQLGTCHWMAPEVIENKEYTLKADIFSFGVMINKIKILDNYLGNVHKKNSL
jgi:serine/threonine protein kinase